MFKTKTITLDFKGENRPPTKADFTYKIGPDAIEIVDTGRGRLSVTEDLEAVMRRLEYWHMGSLSGFKISCRDQNRRTERRLAIRENGRCVLGFTELEK